MNKDKKNKKEAAVKIDTLQIISAIYILIGTIIICTLVIVTFIAKNNNTLNTTSTLKEVDKKYDLSHYNILDANSFLTTFNNSDTNVIFWGRETCDISIKQIEIVNEKIKDTNIKINYIDIETVTDEEYNKLSTLNDFIADYFWTTPIIIITKDGKIIDSQIGYADYDAFTNFLNKNNIKK